MAISEAPYQIEQYVDRGETKEQVLFGAKRAMSYIKGVLKSPNRFDRFNADLIDNIHDRIAMVPGIKGFLRETDATTVGGENVRGSSRDLPRKMYLFSKWLNNEMQLVKDKPEDIVFALKTAAAAHFGLTSRDFHPYDNGNGRTARVLSNAILMTQAYEMTAFGLIIPPVPIVRDHLGDMEYIKVLLTVEETKTLNPLMIFFAKAWSDNLREIINRLNPKVVASKSTADKRLLDKLENRLINLQTFISKGADDSSSNSEYKTFPIPDYFAPNLVKFDHA